jgi:hypothetical protein
MIGEKCCNGTEYKKFQARTEARKGELEPTHTV